VLHWTFAFNVYGSVETFYISGDTLVLVSSRLRGNETQTYKLVLPEQLYRIDADPAANNRDYANWQFTWVQQKLKERWQS